MKRFSIAVAALLAFPGAVTAAPKKPLTLVGPVPGQLQAGDTITLNASTASAAPINIPPGAAPSAPNNGDKWTTADGEFTRINGATVEVSRTNLGSVAAGGVSGTLGLANGGTGAGTASGARTNLGLGSAATVNTGTSGANVPLLNSANTWSAGQAFTGTTSDVASPTFVTSGYASSHTSRIRTADCGTMFTAAQGGLSGVSVSDVCFTVPSGVTTHQFNGLAVVGESSRSPNHATLDGDVGIYYQFTSKANGGNILGLNGVVADTAGFTGQTIQNELDFNRNASDTSVVGLALTINGSISGAAGNGFLCRNPSFSNTFWQTCFFSPGPADIALFAGTRRAGNSQPSQLIQLASTSSGGTTYNAMIQGDASGSLLLKPGATGAAVVVQDQDGTVAASLSKTGVTAYGYDATGSTPLYVGSYNATSVTTKSVKQQFLGTDTIGVQKNVASFTITPADVNYSGATMTVAVRASDTVKTAAIFQPNGVQLPGVTFATLPACAAGYAGMVAYVTDATASGWNTAVTGGGSSKLLAVCNGSNWMAH